MLCDLPRIEFCDDGFSGTNFDRPDFQRMIECAKRGEISCIVVKDLSRFGRDYLEVGDYLEHIFPFLGIRFKSINDHYDSAKHEEVSLSRRLERGWRSMRWIEPLIWTASCRVTTHNESQYAESM